MNDKSNIWNIGNARTKFHDDYFEVEFPQSKIPRSLEKSPYFKVFKTSSGYKIQISSTKLNDLVVSDWSIETLHRIKSKRFLVRLLKGLGWDQFKRSKYLISADEQVALSFLSVKPSGKVLVYDNECLQCEYHSEYKPAVYSNLRNYVGKLAKKKLVYNSTIIESKDRIKAKEILNEFKIKYIYLAKYESYIEKLPFSPGDLGIEKIFENANAVVWEVVK